jgi:hypothetical protein
MTFPTCGRCGAVARVIAGGIANLERNCFSDCYRCEDCGTMTWRDRTRWNFAVQENGKEPGVVSTRGEREPTHV